MKATEQYIPVVLFIMLYRVILTFESVDEIVKCDHLNESHWALLSCGTVYYVVQTNRTDLIELTKWTKGTKNTNIKMQSATTQMI